jgi:hypothetical protein
MGKSNAPHQRSYSFAERVRQEVARGSKERFIKIESDADVALARRAGRSLARLHGFGSKDVVVITTIISALAQNVLAFATRGEMHLRIFHLRRRRAGIPERAQARG